MAIELSGEAPPKKKEQRQQQSGIQVSAKIIFFQRRTGGDYLSPTEVRQREEMGRTNDPSYCLFHIMVHHPTSRCFVLKDKIQALVDAGVLALKSEQKKVTANIVTLNFGTFPMTTV